MIQHLPGVMCGRAGHSHLEKSMIASRLRRVESLRLRGTLGCDGLSSSRRLLKIDRKPAAAMPVDGSGRS
jgi:hypothetical protein